MVIESGSGEESGSGGEDGRDTALPLSKLPVRSGLSLPKLPVRASSPCSGS